MSILTSNGILINLAQGLRRPAKFLMCQDIDPGDEADIARITCALRAAVRESPHACDAMMFFSQHADLQWRNHLNFRTRAYEICGFSKDRPDAGKIRNILFDEGRLDSPLTQDDLTALLHCLEKNGVLWMGAHGSYHQVFEILMEVLVGACIAVGINPIVVQESCFGAHLTGLDQWIDVAPVVIASQGIVDNFQYENMFKPALHHPGPPKEKGRAIIENIADTHGFKGIIAVDMIAYKQFRGIVRQFMRAVQIESLLNDDKYRRVLFARRKAMKVDAEPNARGVPSADLFQYAWWIGQGSWNSKNDAQQPCVHGIFDQ